LHGRGDQINKFARFCGFLLHILSMATWTTVSSQRQLVTISLSSNPTALHVRRGDPGADGFELVVITRMSPRES
jgi:hypothetical protein